MYIDVVDQALGVAVVVTAGAFVLAALRLTSVRRAVLLAAAASYAIHIALSWVVWIGYPALISADAHVYDNTAVDLAGWWSGTSTLSPTVSVGKEGVIFLLAGLYYLFGYVPLAGLAGNALMFAGTVALVGDAADRLAGRRAAITASLLMLVHPSMLVWGAQLLREPAAWLCIAALANIGTRIVAGGLTWHRAGSMFFVGALFVPIRSMLAVLVVAAFGVALVVIGSDGPRRSSTRFWSLCMLLAGTAVVVVLAPLYGGLDITSKLDPSTLAQNRNALSRTATTGLGQEVLPSYGSLLSQLPTTLVTVAFGPFPWQVSGGAAVALADTAAWWITCALAALGWRREVGRPRWLMLIVAVSMVIVLAGTLANIGVILRMRAQVVVLLAPLAAVGFVRLLDALIPASRRSDHAPNRQDSSLPAATIATARTAGVRRRLVPGALDGQTMPAPLAAEDLAERTVG